MKTIVTKAEYAKLKGRKGPSSVSNWIKDGKITAAALVGAGVRAKIWVEQADADLLQAIDPAQNTAQQNPLKVTQTAAPAAAHAQSSGENPVERDDAILRRRRTADAEKAEHEAEASRRRNALDEGRWVDAAAAQQEFGRQLAKLTSENESFLFNTLARAIAERNGLDWKVVSTQIREANRKHRTRLSDEAKTELQEIEGAQLEAAE